MSNRGTKKGVRGTGIAFSREDHEEIQGKKKEIGQLLRMVMKKKKITYRKLEDIAGVYASQLTQMMNGKGNYVIENFLRVLDAMGLEFVLINKGEDETKRKDQIVNQIELEEERRKNKELVLEIEKERKKNKELILEMEEYKENLESEKRRKEKEQNYKMRKIESIISSLEELKTK